MEKKNNSMLEVGNFLLVLIVGAFAIDFVMTVACKRVEYYHYYGEMHEYVIVAFEVLVVARFVAKKIGEALPILRECKHSFSWKSLLYLVGLWVFFIFAVVGCADSVYMAMEKQPISQFVYFLIATAVSSCVAMHFYDAYLRERVKAKNKKEQKKEETNDKNSTLH